MLNVCRENWDLENISPEGHGDWRKVKLLKSKKENWEKYFMTKKKKKTFNYLCWDIVYELVKLATTFTLTKSFPLIYIYIYKNKLHSNTFLFNFKVFFIFFHLYTELT